MMIYAKLQSSRVRHQYGIFGGKSQTSFTRNTTRAGSEEGRLFLQATVTWTHGNNFDEKFKKKIKTPHCKPFTP